MICTDESEGVPELENDFTQQIEYIISVLRDAHTLVADLDKQQVWNYFAPHIKQIGR